LLYSTVDFNLLCIFAVVVFNLQNTGNIAKAIVGEKVGTFIGCTRNQDKSAEGALDQEKSLVK
jgi:uridylate kinase